MIDWHSCQICYPLEINKTYYSVCWSTQPINSCSEVNPSIVISRHDRHCLSQSTQSAVAVTRWSCRSWSVDMIDNKLIGTINSCSEQHQSIVSIVINRHDRHGRHNQLLTLVDRKVRDKLPRSTGSWSISKEPPSIVLYVHAAKSS